MAHAGLRRAEGLTRKRSGAIIDHAAGADILQGALIISPAQPAPADRQSHLNPIFDSHLNSWFHQQTFIAAPAADQQQNFLFGRIPFAGLPQAKSVSAVLL
jgi:hypothetical protein